MTVLIIASFNSPHQVVELLHKQHANINHQAEHGWTALILTSENGIQIVELLLKDNADINAQNEN